MARSTLANLITTLRGMADAGTADYTSGGATYWTDDQLEDILDRHETIVNYQSMTARGTQGAGTVSYTEYWTGYRHWEDGATIQDASGATMGTADYSFDANRGRVTFAANTLGAARFVTGTVYDLNLAAAEVWRKKAAYYTKAYDVSTDNHSLKRSQLAAQCLQMARAYEAAGGPTVAYMDRGDC